MRKHCERCTSRRFLLVHHKDRDQSNNEDHSNLETLCSSCHNLEHVVDIPMQQRGESISKALLAYYADPQKREGLAAAHANDASRARHRAAAKARGAEIGATLQAIWDDPAGRARMLEAQRIARLRRRGN